MTDKRVWEARTRTPPDEAFLAYSESVDDDAPLVEHDLAGSVAHVLGLARAGIVTDKEAVQLADGLQGLAAAWRAGTFEVDPALEDVHMNIEARLADELGDVAAKLHTGRSRNDQVQTATVLYLRQKLASLATAQAALAGALMDQAADHASTPWAARTHGMPAQPATLGFLLVAHALRFQDLTTRTLEVLDRASESALGSGAVAGSSLPLDPAFTAQLLGLGPPRNALVATGARDHALETVQLAAAVGVAVSSLAEELVQLHATGQATLPAAFTTGSSLMPHKRNPDALELARAHGRALAGPAAAVQALLAGLPMGYHRDFQLVKPHLTQALTLATDTVDLVARVVTGTTFDPKALAASLEAPGITSTDVVEAMVQTGVPFRTAYRTVAEAYAAGEADGAPFDEALAEAGADLPDAAIEAALAARVPDPARRATLGGAAPGQVAAQLDQAAVVQAVLAERIGQATAGAARASRLLSTPAVDLLARTDDPAHAPSQES